MYIALGTMCTATLHVLSYCQILHSVVILYNAIPRHQRTKNNLFATNKQTKQKSVQKALKLQPET